MKTKPRRRRPAAEFRPSYQAALPENFDATLAAINAEASRLATQFRDGEIDFDDYTAAVNEVNAHRDALTATKIKAEIAAEMQAQDSQQTVALDGGAVHRPHRVR